MRGRFYFSRDDYVKYHLPANAVKVSDTLSDAVAYLYDCETPKGPRPCACVFFGKQAKPVQRYCYRNTAEREEAVRRCFESRCERDKRKLAQRADDKAYQHDAKVGDIYSTCWGYDQTNVEFFEIVEIRGKFAILREIACAVDDGTLGGPQERIVPQSGQYLEPAGKPGFVGSDRGQPIRRLIQKHGIKIDDVRHASKWGAREPITGTVIGRAVSRTGSGWGH